MSHLKQHVKFVKLPNFAKKKKKKKKSQNLGPNALFQYLWARIFKNYCHISNQRPQSSQIAKFFEKTKMPKFGTKNALFQYLWARILKN